VTRGEEFRYAAFDGVGDPLGELSDDGVEGSGGRG
jgi:hypothetical protein